MDEEIKKETPAEVKTTSTRAWSNCILASGIIGILIALLDLFIMFDFYNVSRGLFNVYTGLFFLLFYLSACVVMIITHKTYNGISISITCVLLWISVYANLYADIYRMISLPALILSFTNLICYKHTLVWIIQSFILVALCVLGNVIVCLI